VLILAHAFSVSFKCPKPKGFYFSHFLFSSIIVNSLISITSSSFLDSSFFLYFLVIFFIKLRAMEQHQRTTRRSVSSEDNDSVMILDAIDLNPPPLYHTLTRNPSRNFTRNPSTTTPYVDGHYIFHVINENHTSRRSTVGHVYHNLPRVEIEEGMKCEALMCSICLAELSVGSKAIRLLCLHIYHDECIMKWLDRSNTCPMCRQSVSHVSS